MKPLLTFTFLSLVFASATFAQEEMQMAEPTEQHKMLTGGAGVWDADITFWVEGPDGPTSKSKGVETVQTVGPFWVASDLEYEFMGMNVKGHGVMGYDPGKEKFVGTWFDSTNPLVSTMEGSLEKDKNRIAYVGAFSSPEGEIKFKILDYLPKDGKKEFEMHMQVPGTDEFAKFMHITYTKRADK